MLIKFESRITPAYAGKSQLLRQFRYFLGIIPAYAGKSSIAEMTLLIVEDHPRIRGKKDTTRSSRTRLPGSPPHTREKVGEFRNHKTKGGITPAYAGKSSLLLSLLYGLLGSPPHTREKGWFLISSLIVLGITPAYAGKRLKNPYNINLDFQIDPEVYSLHL